MSSGQKQRVPANFPNMKYRGRARARHVRIVQRLCGEVLSVLCAALHVPDLGIEWDAPMEEWFR